MTTSDQIPIPPSEEQPAWVRQKGKTMCRRVPEAGEGSCWYWWEGCPEGEKRGCYQRWYHQQRKGKT